MPKARVRNADEFVYDLAEVFSRRVLDQVRKNVELLAYFPELGSANVRESLVERYGPHLRKIAISTFVIVYRYENDVVDVLALVYGPSIR